jgi:hypothetical protein
LPFHLFSRRTAAQAETVSLVEQAARARRCEDESGGADKGFDPGGYAAEEEALAKPVRRKFRNPFTGEESVVKTREPEWPEEAGDEPERENQVVEIEAARQCVSPCPARCSAGQAGRLSVPGRGGTAGANQALYNEAS